MLWEGLNPGKAVGCKEKIKFKGPEEDEVVGQGVGKTLDSIS